MIGIWRDFPFTTTHAPNVRHDHVLRIFVEGPLDRDGVVLDIVAMKKIVGPIVSLVDGKPLESLHERCSTAFAKWASDQPTCEYLVLWFAERLQLLASARPAVHDVPGAPLRLMRLELSEDGNVGAFWEPTP